MRIAQWALVTLLAAPLGGAAARQSQQAPPSDQSSSAEQQDNSVAAAARRAQEQKKEQPKAAKVWDNDTMPSNPGGINVVGSGEVGGAQQGAPEAGQKPAAPVTPEQKAAIESNLSAAKAKLESLKTDLDIATRKYALDEQMYMGKPDYQKDKEGAAAMDAEKQDIEAKQQEIADAQKQIDDLQAQADAANTTSK